MLLAAIAGLLTTGPARLCGEDGLSTTPRVGVIVRNLTDLSEKTLVKSEADSRGVFLAAGIQVAWINATGNVTWNGPDIVIRAAIVPHAPKSRGGDVLGIAAPSQADGIQLFIYYDKVLALSWLTDLPVQAALSAALVHEIGHMLLQSSSHSVAGPMRSEWGGRELNELSSGLLRFAPKESAQMRSYVLSGRRNDVH
jgi:hypothetical protein